MQKAMRRATDREGQEETHGKKGKKGMGERSRKDTRARGEHAQLERVTWRRAHKETNVFMGEARIFKFAGPPFPWGHVTRSSFVRFLIQAGDGNRRMKDALAHKKHLFIY